jgi:hypothetical protein
MQTVIYTDTVVMQGGGCGSCERGVEVQEIDTMANVREVLVSKLDVLAERCYELRSGIAVGSYDSFLEAMEIELQAVADELSLSGVPVEDQQSETQRLSADDHIIWGT